MFVKLEKKHIETIYEFLKNDNTDDTTYAAISLLGWMAPWNTQIKICEDCVVVRFEYKNDGEAYLTPLVKDKENFDKAVKSLYELKASQIHGVLDWQIDTYKKHGYDIKYSRDNSEYLYEPQSLITLRGKKYHSKRNFINSFPNKYIWRPYTGSLEDKKAIFEMFCRWVFWRTGGNVKPCEDPNWRSSEAMVNAGYDLEINVLEMMLEDCKAFSCKVHILEVDGEIAGFVGGEILPNNIGVIYFEKGDTQYRGVYPLIDNLFCKEHFDSPNIRYINKQEDMGIEGLKKSKQSYRPVKLADRYIAVQSFDGKPLVISSEALNIGS